MRRIKGERHQETMRKSLNISNIRGCYWESSNQWSKKLTSIFSRCRFQPENDWSKFSFMRNIIKLTDMKMMLMDTCWKHHPCMSSMHVKNRPITKFSFLSFLSSPADALIPMHTIRKTVSVNHCREYCDSVVVVAMILY